MNNSWRQTSLHVVIGIITSITVCATISVCTGAGIFIDLITTCCPVVTRRTGTLINVCNIENISVTIYREFFICSWGECHTPSQLFQCYGKEECFLIKICHYTQYMSKNIIIFNHLQSLHLIICINTFNNFIHYLHHSLCQRTRLRKYRNICPSHHYMLLHCDKENWNTHEYLKIY